MILLDTSGLYSFIDTRQPHHGATARTLDSERPPFVLSPFVLAEVDYFILRDGDPRVESEFLGDVAAGAYELAPFTPDDIDSARAVVDRYRNLRIGLADASIVVLADRYETNRVLTLDERHFRALRPRHAKSFVVLPADA